MTLLHIKIAAEHQPDHIIRLSVIIQEEALYQNTYKDIINLDDICDTIRKNSPPFFLSQQ